MMFGANRRTRSALTIACAASAIGATGAFAIQHSSDAADAPPSTPSTATATLHPQPEVPAETKGESDRFIVRYDSRSKLTKKQRTETFRRGASEVNLRFTSSRSTGFGADVVQLSKKVDKEKAHDFIQALNDEKGIASVEVDRIMQTYSAPDDPEYSKQWDMNDPTAGINLDKARERSTGRGVTVAVIDTGITDHPELNANRVGGYDFVSNPAGGRDGDGRDSNPNDEGDYSDASCGRGSNPSSWHGTHVAGTIAAATGNGTGVAGVAGDARILPVRVLGACGSGYSSDIIDGMLWAAGETVPGVPDNPNPAQVLNLSLGGADSCNSAYQGAIDRIRAKGATVVVAAGNSGVDVSRSTPANCEGVVAVAASDNTGGMASYSNHGSRIDLTAPGGGGGGEPGDILSTENDGTTTPGGPAYDWKAGTSMAAPHVAGVAALIKSMNPSFTPDQVEERLRSTTRPLPGSCDDGCGTGLLDAAAAVGAAGGSPESLPSDSATDQPTGTPTTGAPTSSATGQPTAVVPTGRPTAVEPTDGPTQKSTSTHPSTPEVSPVPTRTTVVP